MRKKFIESLVGQMRKDSRIVFMTGDLGFNLIEPVRDEFPDRYFNMQASEFAMTGAAIGMSYCEKIPILYSITPFIIFRNFELLRTYVNYENTPIKIVGGGRNNDYKTEGKSHDASDVKGFLDLLPNIQQFWPENDDNLLDLMPQFLFNEKPSFISLKK